MGAFNSHRFEPSQTSMAVANQNTESVWLLAKAVPMRVPTVDGASKSSVDVTRVATEGNIFVADTATGLKCKAGGSRQGELPVRG